MPALATVQFDKQWAGTPEFDSPIGAAVDSAGHVYVSDAGNSRIEEVDSDGILVRTWGSFGSGEGQLKVPVGVALDSSGNVYVAEVSNNRIDEFSPSGAFIRTWGWGVADGTTNAFQTCTSSCHAGISGSGDGQFTQPRDIAFDSLGNLYVADSGNNRIQKFDSTSSRIYVTQWGTSGTADLQFDNPFALAIDPSNDHVYVADVGNNRIQEFDSSGAFQVKWGTYGTAENQFAGPRGVAVDGSGNVYVSDSFNNRIQKFDSTATHDFVSAWGYGVSDGFSNYEICTSGCQAGIAGSSQQQFDFPIHLATDPSNDVFVVENGNNRVEVFDSSGSPFVPFANRFGSFGSNGQFDAPAGLASDSSGNVYLADNGMSRLAKFDASGVRLASVAGPGSAQAQVMAPRGVAVNSSGSIYVADTGNQRIEKFSPFNPFGGFLVMWGNGVNNSGADTCDGTGGDICGPGTPGSGSGEFDQPYDAAVGAAGTVYVADYNNSRIQKFDSSGNFMLMWGEGVDQTTGGDVCTAASGHTCVGGTGGTGSGQFQAPSGVVTDSSGNVYVADALNFRIQKFGPSGNFLLMWGKGVNQTTGGDICTAASGDTCGVGGSAPGNSQFLSLDYLGVDSSNNVYVPDCSRNDVQVFRPTGVFVKKWGSPGSGEGEFDCPVDVAPHNAVLQVSDLNNKRVEKFTETDTTAPNTTINSAPSSTTNDTTPNFAFSSSEPAGALFECRVDSSSPNAYEPCTSPHSTAALAEGSHTFAARAIDAAGNPDASPATRRFTVDTTPPDTSITAGPSGPTADRTPTFSFTATEAGSTFKCKVDSQAFAPCRSPKTTAPLADGVHRFYVRATDRAGNSDTSPAHRGIKVDTHRPSSMANAPTSTHRSPFLVAYTASDPSPTTGLFQVELWVHRPGTTGYVKVAVDTTPTTTRSFLYTPSAGAGNYAFFTRAKDKVGNYETPPSSPDAHTQFSP